MRAPCGCIVEEGIVMHGYDGPCSERSEYGDGPTEEDYCASGGHAYHGDESVAVGPEVVDMVGRCFCGAQIYPAGGPT